jgi:hypothetical protein
VTQKDCPINFRELCAVLNKWVIELAASHPNLSDSGIAKINQLVDHTADALAQSELVPVAERLPGLQDCDAEGKCWWWVADEPGAFPHWIYAPLEAQTWAGYSAWLPHHALPVPQAS